MQQKKAQLPNYKSNFPFKKLSNLMSHESKLQLTRLSIEAGKSLGCTNFAELKIFCTGDWSLHITRYTHMSNTQNKAYVKTHMLVEIVLFFKHANQLS